MIDEVINLMVDCIKSGGKVLTFGVGGNAANAIHFAAELSGKYEQFDEPLPCICLSENPAILTAITNDFGWEHVFERQVRALAKPGDVIIAFSISSKGEYLRNAFIEAYHRGCTKVLITGLHQEAPEPGGYQNFSKVDLEFCLNSDNTPWVQEEQLRIIHQICGKVKEELSK